MLKQALPTLHKTTRTEITSLFGEAKLVLDETAFEAGGMYLFGSVLTEFFRKYVSINHVTETVVFTDSKKEVARWPVKAGLRPQL